MIGTEAGPERANCGNKSEMVRLPDQCSSDKLPIFSCHCQHQSALNKVDALIGVHISPWLATPHLTPRQVRGVYFLAVQPPCSTKCTGPTLRYYAARVSPVQATNSTCDVEHRLARTSCGPLLPLTTNLSDSIFGDILGALETLRVARAAVHRA